MITAEYMRNEQAKYQDKRAKEEFPNLILEFETLMKGKIQSQNSCARISKILVSKRQALINMFIKELEERGFSVNVEGDGPLDTYVEW